MADSINNGGRTLSPRPISNFTSIGAVDSSGPQVDIPGLLAGLPPVATDLAGALKEFEPSFLDRNASALAAQQVAADNAAQFAGIAGAYSRFGKGYTDYAINNVPAAPGVTIWDANNPLGLQLSGTPPLLLNRFGALDARPPVGPQLVPSDGVVRESAAVSYLRASGALDANAGTIESQVGPVIQPFVLASIPGGQFALAAQGGYQMGQGYGQYQNGDTTTGALNMFGGALTVAGSGAAMYYAGAGTEAAIGLAETRILGARTGGVEFGTDPLSSGGPLRQLGNGNVKITTHGVDVVENHVSRFGEDAANQAMIGRLRGISDGQINGTVADYNFYTHELREFTRVRSLGYETGVLPDEVY